MERYCKNNHGKMTGITNNTKRGQVYYCRTCHCLSEIKRKNKIRTDNLRDEILKRDNYQCVMCFMTQQEHIDRWDRGLTINHIDGLGRYSEIKNNNPKNLETLCLVCHGYIDNQLRGLKGYAKNYKKQFA